MAPQESLPDLEPLLSGDTREQHPNPGLLFEQPKNEFPSKRDEAWRSEVMTFPFFRGNCFPGDFAPAADQADKSALAGQRS